MFGVYHFLVHMQAAQICNKTHHHAGAARLRGYLVRFVCMYHSDTLMFWSFTKGSLQKHVSGIENQILWLDFRFGFAFRKCVLPEGLATKTVPIAKKTRFGI